MRHLNKFRKNHLIDKKANLSDISVTLECVAEANQLAVDFISNVECDSDEKSFINYTHLNLIGRIFEQVEGMLACIVIKSPTSSEALGRIIVEGAINLMYMSSFGYEKSILAFFYSWVNEHEKKLNLWKKLTNDKEYKDIVMPMIEERIKTIGIYSGFVQHGIDKFNVNSEEFNKFWPKSIFERFEALKQEESYYTVYHRLSGSSHITAEDTISWLMSLDYDEKQKYILAKEAWSFSIMMARITCTYFIEALILSCRHHGMTSSEELEKLLNLKRMIEESISEIEKDAGVPQT